MLGDPFEQDAQKYQAISHFEWVGIMKVEFELGIGAFELLFLRCQALWLRQRVCKFSINSFQLARTSPNSIVATGR